MLKEFLRQYEDLELTSLQKLKLMKTLTTLQEKVKKLDIGAPKDPKQAKTETEVVVQAEPELGSPTQGLATEQPTFSRSEVLEKQLSQVRSDVEKKQSELENEEKRSQELLKSLIELERQRYGLELKLTLQQERNRILADAIPKLQGTTQETPVVAVPLARNAVMR